MAEGVAVADRVTGTGVHDDPDTTPAPSAEAPRGWTWNRKGGHWQPKVRGKILWAGVGSENDTPDGGEDQEQGGTVQQLPRRDPAPAWMAEAAAEPRPEPVQASQQVKDDIGGILGFAGALILPKLAAADPHCGGALAGNYDKIVDKCIPLIARSQTVVRFLTSETGGLMDWIGLGMALMPVGKAVLEHHVTRSVVTLENEETGERIAAPADYSAYPAAA